MPFDFGTGRAGRVRAGRVWRLYPLNFHAQLPEHTAPEMLRTPLDNLVLQILRLGLGQPLPFLRAALQPPSDAAIDAAVNDLRQIGALSSEEDEHIAPDQDDSDDEPPERDDELFSMPEGGLDSSDDESEDTVEEGTPWRPLYSLTPLGFHVASLPMDCRIAKLLLYGSVFECVEATLTIAAGLSVAKDVFSAPFHLRREASAQKRKLARDSDSDLVALVFAYDAWKREDPRAR